MATATIKSFTLSPSGDWPTDATWSGYWIKAATTDGAATASLPATVTSCAWSSAPGYRYDASPPARFMALPGSSARNPYSWVNTTYPDLFITTTGPVAIAIHGYTTGGLITAAYSILDTAGATLASASLAIDNTNCCWLRATINGSVRIRQASDWMRFQGVLFAPVGSPLKLLPCIEPGSTGLFA